MSYQGRVAIVTGASSGIGRALAVDLARRGASVIGVARRAAKLEETLAAVRKEGAEALDVVGDVADRDVARRAVALSRERFGRLDFLVNNAGISKRKHLLDATPEDAERVIGVNLLGPIYFILEALPLLVDTGDATIVNVSSIAGRMGNPRESLYCASKFGLCGLSEAMYHDLHRRGVHTLLVNPGPIATEIWDTLEAPAAYRGKLHPAEDVSRAILRAIEKRRHEITVPRIFGFVAILKSLFPALVRRGASRFDPDVVEPARPRSRSGEDGVRGSGG